MLAQPTKGHDHHYEHYKDTEELDPYHNCVLLVFEKVVHIIESFDHPYEFDEDVKFQRVAGAHEHSQVNNRKDITLTQRCAEVLYEGQKDRETSTS